MEPILLRGEVIFTPELTEKSVLVIPEPTIEYLKGLQKFAQGLRVETQEDFADAARMLNGASKIIAQIKEIVTAKRRPYAALADGVSEKAKPFLELADALKASLNREMKYYDDREEAYQMNACLNAEREKSRLEAEAKALELEAANRLRAGKDALKSAGNEEQFAQAGEGFRAGAEAQQRAAELIQQTKALNPIAFIAPRAKGARKNEPVENLVYDLAKLPIEYHLANEALIVKAIKAGILTEKNTPGLSFTLGKNFSGTGR
jgi:hypothetical protein